MNRFDKLSSFLSYRWHSATKPNWQSKTAGRKKAAGRSKAASLVLLICLGWAGLGLSSGAPSSALAQETDTVWDTPVNLSRSGGAQNPFLIPGANGVLHVLWEDVFDGLVYTLYNGSAWQPPEFVELPIETTRIQFYTGKENQIHAFWFDERSQLFHSRVDEADFTNPVAWTPPVPMAESAVAAHVAVDAQGGLHLAYVRNIQTGGIPAGVYYKRSSDNGYSWSEPVSIYQSSYFRNLTPELSNIRIASSASAESTGSPWVYITWDNRPRKQVFLATSKNGGSTWEAPVEIARPEAGSGSATAFNIQISVVNQKALLTWQVGEPGSYCSQVYQWSEDGGQTWSVTQPVVADTTGCPQEVHILPGGENLFYLVVTIQDQILLLAWNGQQWSRPQSQPDLNSFTDPETFNTVNYRCRNFAYLPASDRLLVVGCDTGSNEDIWFTGRTMGEIGDWYPPEVVWMDPRTVAASDQPLQSPIVIADGQEGVHVFWSQKDAPEPVSDLAQTSPTTSIHYALWSGASWVVPGAVLFTVEGESVQPALTLDPEGRLLAVWSTGKPGEMYFSWASAERAMSITEWASPQLLPLPQYQARTPDILVDAAGVIYVVYAVPLNEGRGIYLIRSADVGKTWSEPVPVFDGQTAGWEMVDDPRIAMTGDGRLHLLWTKMTVPFGSGVLGLFYASSEDGGQSWTEPAEVVGKPFIWSEINGIGQEMIHRFWQESNGGSTIIWHDHSLDSGITWSRPEIVSSFLGTSGLANITTDIAGRVHMLQLVEKGQSDFLLQHSVWDGVNWSTLENGEFTQEGLEQVSAISASLSPSGRLAVVFAGTVQENENSQPQDVLFYSERLLELPAVSLQPVTTRTPQATASPEPTLTPTSQPTPTLDLASLGPGPAGQDGLIFGNAYGGLILGAILVSLAITAALGYRVISAKVKNTPS